MPKKEVSILIITLIEMPLSRQTIIAALPRFLSNFVGLSPICTPRVGKSHPHQSELYWGLYEELEEAIHRAHFRINM